MNFIFDSCINEKIVCDVKGNIVLKNAKFKETFGDGPFLDKFSDEILKVPGYLESFANQELSDPMVCQKSFLTHKGEQVFEIYISPYDGNYIVTLKNITEIIELQKLFFTSQKHRSIGIMASGLSHDFKNTLQNIKIYLAIIQQSEDKNEIKRYFDTIDKLISDSQNYINTLLQTAGTRGEEKTVSNVDELLKSTINILEKIIANNITITYFNQIPDTKIKVSPAILKQILINICVNAAEAIGEKCDGIIGMLVGSSNSSGVDYVKISVTDNGCGISADELKMIFKPFFTTKNSKGTGLGLTMVGMAVKNMGGFVEADSVKGEWTNISIHLPVGNI